MNSSVLSPLTVISPSPSLLLTVTVGFALTNPQTVSVTLWATTYTDVALGLVALVALASGIVFTMIIALVEGTAIRLGNRRLRREIHRLETELHFVRTHPTERDESPSAAADPPVTPAESTRANAVPAAPVYSSETLGPPSDVDDDDPYAGGRAV